MMKYAALTVLFLIVCTSFGLRGGSRAGSMWSAAVLALAMVAAQFALLMSQ